MKIPPNEKKYQKVIIKILFELNIKYVRTNEKLQSNKGIKFGFGLDFNF